MSVEFFLLNPNLSICYIGFWLGVCLIIFGQLKYIKRSKKPIMFNPFDFFYYNDSEKKIIIIGFIIVFISIFSLRQITENFGYNTIVYDVDGKKTIEKIYGRKENLNE